MLADRFYARRAHDAQIIIRRNLFDRIRKQEKEQKKKEELELKLQLEQELKQQQVLEENRSSDGERSDED